MGDMVKGNVAMGEAAIRAGMHMYAGYPITPSTEIMEYLSWRAPQEDRVFIQAESEMAAMKMVYGAAATGARVLTASSGLGISCKQEGVSYMNMAQYPGVMINVVRYGDGLGSLLSGQTDYLREVKGAGNGDARMIVLSPSSVQEAYDLVYESFDISQKYKNLVMILTEGGLGQMMEECEYSEMKTVPFASWGYTGNRAKDEYRPMGFASSVYDHALDMAAKRVKIKEEMQRWESDFIDDAEYVMIGYGLPGRAIKSYVKARRAEGEKVGYIRPISLWPFPEKAFKEVNPAVKGFISVETSDDGGMIEDVALYGKKYGSGFEKVPVFGLFCPPGIPTLKFIGEKFEDIKSGKLKEVF
jgi:2-oxoglutarate ferredoxin oxidoreductase subunit alpha